MADPVEVILDFLQRHKFAQAEAAFKAELISRNRGEKPVLSSENVLDWDLQLCSRAPQDMASLAEEPNRLSNEQTIISASQLGRETGTIFSARTRSPPEKQLFVEYESGLSKSQDIRGMTSQGFAFEASLASPESEGCGPLSTVPVAESEGSGSIRVDSSQHNQGSLLGTSNLYSLQLLPVEKHAQDGDNKVAEQASRQNHDRLLWHQQNSSSGSEDQGQAFLRTEVQRKFEDAGVTSSTYSLKNVEPDADNSGNQGLISSIHVGKSRVDDKLRGAEEGGLELLSKNSFIPSSMKGSSFKGLALKTPFPLSFLKPFGSEELQKSSLMERDATDIGGLDWTIGELQKFEITDSIVESRVVDDVPVAENKCFSANSMNGSGVLPRLPPVRIHSIDKNLDSFKEAGSVAENENSTQSFESAAFQSIASTPEGAFGWGTLSDGFLSQDVVFQGLKRSVSRPSVSQGIVEDMSEQLSGFATAIDGQSERWYPDDYCDSDTWEDDDDPGYHRQPIEDEEWFLAQEIDYPSDDERARPNADKTPLADAKQLKKLDVDDRSFVEEESYFSGEEYYRQEAAKKESHKSQQYEAKGQGNEAQITYATLYPTNAEDDLLTLSLGNNDDFDYDNHIFDGMELNPLSSQPIWKGFIYEAKEGGRTQDGRADGVDDDNHGSLRSGGLLLSSDAADVGSEVRDSLLGGSSEGDPENYGEQELVTGELNSPEFTSTAIGRHVEVKNAPVRHLDEDEDERDMILQYYNEEWGHTKRVGSSDDSGRSAFDLCSPTKDHCKSKHSTGCSNKAVKDNRGFVFEGFSFPSPSSTGDIATSRAGSGKSLWSNKESTAQEDIDGFGSGLVGPDDTLAVWKQKSNNSSPIIGSSEDTLPNLNLLNESPVSPHSTDDYVSLEAREDGLLESDVGGTDVGGPSPKACQPSAQEEEDAVATQEEIRPLSAEDDQYEIFDLRIIHRKNRTGFEEDKDFPVMINSVIAGRYHVTEYLGSAAFSKAIQAHDLHTGIDVCMKIIKNNKDFFDQSLDEIKLLKFVNKHDPADKYHVLRLYDYFYHREHLFIVCELLRANLYEFHKFNRESGGEVYFTMPRLQSITVQCLEALEFLHGLGIIHCDLKPENILVKSYSRCEIKIIDLGSSCFQTDHLCSYVQSRSYRAPEVILGLPYDQKIDIWSLGCILAELCTGNVLFQNDSLATLLARVIGILGPIDQDVLAKGRDTYKYFTKNHMLYERNQETDQLEYLLPKKTSLGHRLPMGDQGFVEFVGYLLQHNPAKRPTASEALRHPWLSYPYEPISS